MQKNYFQLQFIDNESKVIKNQIQNEYLSLLNLSRHKTYRSGEVFKFYRTFCLSWGGKTEKAERIRGRQANLWKHGLNISSSILRKYNILCSPGPPTSSLRLLCKEEKFLIHQTTFCIKDKLFRYLFLLFIFLIIFILITKRKVTS